MNGDTLTTGAIFAGELINRGQVTGLTDYEEIVIGPFYSAGKPRALTLGYSYFSQRFGSLTQSPNVSGPSSAVVALEKRVGADWVELTRLVVNGTNQVVPANEADGVAGSASNAMSGGLTYTDAAGGAGDYTYRGRIIARTHAVFTGPGSQSSAQRVGVVSVE